MISDQRAELGSRAYGWALAALLAGFAVWPALALPIEERAYDAASFHVMRGVVFSQALSDGAAYPRWAATINSGLGGPLFTFYSPLAYYAMDGLNRLGLPHPLGWRALVALALALAALGMFGLGQSLAGRADAALAAAACYAYSPALLRDLFERGSPQGIALALVPLALWSLVRLADRPSGLRLLLAALAHSAVIFAHNLTGLMALPFAALILAHAWMRRGPRAAAIGFAALVMGGLLAAIHAIPFWAERDWVKLDQARAEAFSPLNPPALSLGEMLALTPIPTIGMGNNAYGHSVGAWQAVAILAGAAAAVWLWRRGQKALAVVAGGSFVIALAGIGLRLEAARPVWNALPFLDATQIRWRLIALAGLAAAIGLAAALAAINSALGEGSSQLRRLSPILPIGATALAVGLGLPYLWPDLLPRYAAIPARPSLADAMPFADQVSSPGFTLTAYDEFVPRARSLPLARDEWISAQAGPLASLPEGAAIRSVARSTGRIAFDVETTAAFRARLFQLYYPGWNVTVDGVAVPSKAAPDLGYIAFTVPEGAHRVEATYDGTDDQRAGEAVTLAAAIALIAAAALWRPASRPAPPAETAVLRPRWAVAAALAALIALKGLWLDPHTALLRRSATCDSIADAAGVQAVAFDHRVRLCGFEFGSPPNLRPGDTLRVTLYWSVADSQDKIAYAYVHALGQTASPRTGTIVWAQQDKQIPARHPLTAWEPGLFYQDEYAFELPPDTAPGDYAIEVGWTWPDGTRLPPEIGGVGGPASLSPYQSVIIGHVIVAPR